MPLVIEKERYLPVHDVVSVTVVNTLENLLHEHCGVLLGKLSSGDDLVKELSTLANPTHIQEKGLDSYLVIR